MPLSTKKRPFPAGDLKPGPVKEKKSKLLFLFESLVSKPGFPLAAFGDGHIHSAEWDQNKRSEKSDTVLLDKIKERVLHEDFDGTSESSVSIVTHMSAEQSRNYSKGRGSESTSRWVIKRCVLGYFRASDKELKLTQTKANTWSHIYTNAQQIAKPDGVFSSIRQTRWASFALKTSALIIRMWLLTLTCATNQAKWPPTSVTRSGKCPRGISIPQRKHFTQSL